MKFNNRYVLVAPLILTVAALIGNALPKAAPTPQIRPAPAAPATGTPVSWQVFSGYKRYSGNCQSCHGTDALGGTFAPNLTNSLKTLDKDAFMETVVNGKVEGQLAMPPFGANPNVMCYIDDIYSYLKARSEGKVGRGRPDPQPRKPAEFAAAEAACMGS